MRPGQHRAVARRLRLGDGVEQLLACARVSSDLQREISAPLQRCRQRRAIVCAAKQWFDSRAQNECRRVEVSLTLHLLGEDKETAGFEPSLAGALGQSGTSA